MSDNLMNLVDRAQMNGKPVIFAPVKTIINFESGFKEKLLCDGPTFSAGTSCAYTCSYCYVPAIMAKNANIVKAKESGHTHEGVVIRRHNAVEIVRQQLTDSKGNWKFIDPNDKRIIYASPLVDVAANMELVRETVQICSLILAMTNWQIRLLSKSNLLPKIAEHLIVELGANAKACSTVRERIIFGVSTGTLDDKLAKAIEPDCPLVSKRIESLHWLQDNGYRTFGMICPSLPPVIEDGYDKFAFDMADALFHSSKKCEHVWAEVINIRGESMQTTITALSKAGYSTHAIQLKRISEDKQQWEDWARQTHMAYTRYFPPKTLRFLQYVNKDNLAYWKNQEHNGAVLLGKAAHGN